MNRGFGCIALGGVICLLWAASNATAGVTGEELTQIQQAIQDRGLSWTAGENDISQMNDAQFQAMLMHEPYGTNVVESPRFGLAEELRSPSASNFSWGDYGGHNWMTAIRMQGVCNACWAFSIAGAAEPRMRLTYNQYNMPVDFSEQNLISCSGYQCGAADVSQVLDSVLKYGCVDESCFPYVSTGGLLPPCSNRCSDWQNHNYYIHSNGTYYRPSVATIKNEIQRHGPVTAYLVVYHDFRTYTGGVYQFTSGYLEGTHSVVLYGWNDADSCWLAKNSWGTGWGETGPDGTKGWFRIKMWSDASMLGDPSQIQYYIDWMDYAGSPNFNVVVSPDTADMFFVKQADLDGDKLSDFVYTGRTADSLYIIYGNTANGIDRPRNYFPIKRAALGLGFVNADSALDIVAYTGTMLYTLLRDTLNSRTYKLDSMAISPIAGMQFEPSAGTYPAIAVGYFNSDSYLDVAVSPNHLYFGSGSGTFPGSATLPFNFDAAGTGDYNGDGHDDLVCVVGDSAIIYTNDGAANLTRASAQRVGYRSFDIPSLISDIDWNMDGRADWAVATGRSVAGPDTTVITVALGNGSGGIQATDTMTLLGSAFNIVACNSNSDLNLDLAAMNATQHSIFTYINNGSGSFTPSDTIALVGGSDLFYAIAAADLDRDGNADFLAGGETTARVQLSFNQRVDRPVLPYRTQPLAVSAYNNVNVTLVDPNDYEVSRSLQTVAGSEFWRANFDSEPLLDQKLIDYNLVYGEYKLILTPQPGEPPSGPFTMDIRIDGSQKARIFKGYTGGYSGSGGEAQSISAGTTGSMTFYYDYQAVSLIMPPNGMAYFMNPPTFNWTRLVPPPGSQTRYHFQLDKYFDFRSPIFEDTALKSPLYQPPLSLGEDSVYYWHIRIFDGISWGSYSRTFAVYMGPPCCNGPTGNVNGEGIVDLSDLSLEIAFLLSPVGTVSLCPPEANVNSTGIIDLSDLSLLISYLTTPGGTVQLPNCK